MRHSARKPTIQATGIIHDSFKSKAVFQMRGWSLETDTPADGPNHIIESPKPTAQASQPQSYHPWSKVSFVSGMLSDTADTKPKTKTMDSVAGGSALTVIKLADNTKEHNNTAPALSTNKSGSPLYAKK